MSAPPILIPAPGIAQCQSERLSSADVVIGAVVIVAVLLVLAGALVWAARRDAKDSRYSGRAEQ